MSLFINLILSIAVVVLLVKAKCTANQSSPVTSCSKEKEEEAMDIEIKPNEVYAGTGESIVTKSNVVYGVTLSTEPDSQPGTYEYVTRQ